MEADSSRPSQFAIDAPQNEASESAAKTSAPDPIAGKIADLKPTLVDLSLTVPRPWPSALDLALSLLACVAQVAFADPYYSAPTIAFAGLQAGILALLVTRYLRVRPHRLPWLEYPLAVHYANFVLPVALPPNPVGVGEILPRVDSFEFGSLLALLSSLTMVGGFAFGRWATRRFRFDSMFPNLDPRTLMAGSRIYVPITTLYVVLNALSGSFRATVLPIANILQTIFFLTPLVVVATTVYLTRSTPFNRLQLIAASLIVSGVMLYSSMIGEALVPMIAFFVLWWRGRERVPGLLLALGISGVLILQPVKQNYRSLHWGDHPDIPNPVDAWEEAFTRAATQSQSSFNEQPTGTKSTLDRMNEFSVLAYVVEMVPSSIPHSGGVVYPLVLTAIVPRVFWPEKPDMYKYALAPTMVALGLASPEGIEHSAQAIPLSAEGYYEHGIVGSLAWTALFGATAAFLSRYVGTKLAGIITGASLLIPWGLYVGGGFFTVFAGLLQLVIGATALAWLLWLIGGGYAAPRSLAPARSTF